MGVPTRKRGFSDDQLFMAMTTNPKIASGSMESCKWVNRKLRCVEYRQKWTYAVPLEIVYLTPLQSWNPYNLAFHGRAGSPEAVVVKAGGRNGGLDTTTAYNGTDSKTYYRTPAEFFLDNKKSSDKADTARGTVGVLDPDGAVRLTTASGIRIRIPDIPGVGMIRQRYPIAPVHGEGSAVWKELNALKDVIMKWKTNLDMLYE